MLDNSKYFTLGQIEAQIKYDTHERAKELIDHPIYSSDTKKLWPGFTEFISTRPFFFLASSDAKGNCQCNYRGGEPGFVVVEDEKNLSFPDYEGNGLLHTVGNFHENPHVGLLFIDFETSRRIKVNGRVTLIDEEEQLTKFKEQPGYAEAIRVIHVEVTYAVMNCANYLDRAKISYSKPVSEGKVAHV
jgi:predicted pyridoxine 5'-phosphate oxidase superfamily flavin-nucleotide-binding protein